MKLLLILLLTSTVCAAQPRPTANAGRDTSIYFPMHEIRLNGKGTGTGIKYLWEVYKVTIPNRGNDSLATFAMYDTAAVYTFRLTVTDVLGRKAYDYVAVTALWNPLGASSILNISNGMSPGQKTTLIITNDGNIYQAFEKQNP